MPRPESIAPRSTILLFQIASAAKVQAQSHTDASYVVASSPVEIAALLETLDLVPFYRAMQAEGLDHAVVPHSRLRPIAERCERDVGERVSADPFGQLFAGRYQYSLQMSAEGALSRGGDVVVMREIATHTPLPFDRAPRDGARILVSCAGWTAATHSNDLDDPERRPDGWVTDNRWDGQVWPPMGYLTIPPLPRL
jgi:hypothetical protein